MSDAQKELKNPGPPSPGDTWWQAPGIQRLGMQKGVIEVPGGPRKKTIVSGWCFQDGRIWNPSRRKFLPVKEEAGFLEGH